MAVFGKLSLLTVLTVPTVLEVRCLVYRLTVGVLGSPDSDAVLHWSRWRRRHQAAPNAAISNAVTYACKCG